MQEYSKEYKSKQEYCKNIQEYAGLLKNMQGAIYTKDLRLVIIRTLQSLF